MEKVTTKKLALYSGRTHPALAEEVAAHLGQPLGEPNIVEFSNGEIRPRFAESVRGSDVFIMQSHYGIDGRSINDSIIEQLTMIDAAYRASAKRITAVCPFYGYARQDRKAEGREPITARLVGSRSISTRVRSRASSRARSTTSRRHPCSSTSSASTRPTRP
jgi:ribose-phosphate pyrophosphokinase